LWIQSCSSSWLVAVSPGSIIWAEVAQKSTHPGLSGCLNM
jgi:hypothetical protein